MAQASRKVIVPEEDLDEATLPSPRFDEAAAQQARPVVPLSGEAVPANPGNRTNGAARHTALPSKMGSWLLAAAVGLILGAGAMAVGVTAYRRSHATPARSLVPAASVTALELNRDFRPGPSSRSSAAAAVPKTAAADDTASNAPSDNPPPVPKTVKRSRVAVSTSSEDDSNGTDASGKPKPRLVDRYVMRPPRR
jgi:hypothetical protein